MLITQDDIDHCEFAQYQRDCGKCKFDNKHNTTAVYSPDAFIKGYFDCFTETCWGIFIHVLENAPIPPHHTLYLEPKQ